METKEQRAVIKFCFKIGNTASETYDKIKQVYGESCLSRTRVFDWFKQFKKGRTSVDDEERAGRPRTSNTHENAERIRAILAKDRRVNVRMLADEVGISKGTVHLILRDVLNRRKVCAKLVPHSLTAEQKEARVAASANLVEMADMDADFLNLIVTGDESWCFEYDPTTKRQSSEWIGPDEDRPVKVRASKSKVKTMLITFFDSKGIIHKEFLPPGQTVNKIFYRDVMDRLLKRIRRVRPEYADSGKWYLLHDNAPAHASTLVTQYLAQRRVIIINHPPYSPDLAPADFFCFQN